MSLGHLLQIRYSNVFDQVMSWSLIVISACDVSSDEYKDSNDEWLPLNSYKGNEIETDSLVDCSNCKFKYSFNFDEDYKIKLYSYFWTLEYNRQKDYILSCVTQAPVKHYVSKQVKNAKEFSKIFTFNLNLSKKVRVCKQCFF